MTTPLRDEKMLLEPTEAERKSFGAAFERIVGIMARLRGDGGCPWDREQTLSTLRPYLIEEAYEVLEAIEHGGVSDHKEELGDLLLQVVFQAELRREEGSFDAADVTHGIADKLVRRHPHVFGEEKANAVSEAFEYWEQQKAKEKKGRSAIDGVPRQLPALLRAQRTTEKAGRVGFDWNDVHGPLEKLDEEIGELRRAIESKDQKNIEHEIGDVLFTVVNVARFLNVAAEDSLNATIHRFSERFKAVEAAVRQSGRELKDVELSELEELWQRAKLTRG